MTSSKYPNSALKVLQTIGQTLGSIQGNVLVYLIVLILIFGVLGVTIVSLFTTATSSSATPNNARRAAYVKESAMRYAFSELRNSGFATAVVNTLNTRTYTVNSAGSFTVNIFGTRFVASTDSVGGAMTLNVLDGKNIPVGFSIPANLWVVNYNYLVDLTPPSTQDQVVSWSKDNDTTLTITTSSDFIVSAGEWVCLAVKPYGDPAAFGDGGNLEVQIEAKDFFPQSDGAVNINRFDYVYKKRIDGGDRVTLINISASSMPNSQSPPASLDLSPDDFIVLSPRNFIVIPTGTADTVIVAGTLDRAVNIYNSTNGGDGVGPGVGVGGSPDINLNQFNLTDDLNRIGTTGYVTVNNDDDAKTINIGSGLNSSDVDFGGIWFNANMTIGGKEQVCNAGKCEFGLGVRVFFRLDYDGTADGLTYALISAANNETSSIGGDIDMGELLGYAGDSRTDSTPTSTSDFKDGTGEGLQPPKIALEFDTYNNLPYKADCVDADTIRDNNRNDPFSVDKNQDALQFIFWGRTSLPMPCRDYTIGSNTVADHPTYDDNRHDVGEQLPKWTYPTSNDVRSTPAVSPDGSTVYVGSDDHYLYAVDTATGVLKWKFNTGGEVISSPVVGPDGMVYIGSGLTAGPGRVYGLNPVDRLNQPNGSTLIPSNEWLFYTPNDIDSSPAIGADGTVYIGDEEGNFFALDPASRLADPGGDKYSLVTTKEWLFTNAGFTRTSRGRPAIGPDPSGMSQRIYITSSENTTLFALNAANGAIEWSIDTGETTYFMPAADPGTGVVYIEMGSKIEALYPNSDSKWDAPAPIGTNRFTPVVGNDGMVYVGGLLTHETGKITKLDSTTGDIIWQFTDSASLADIRTTPAIAPDGTIYFGTGDNLLYALNPDGSKKWTFPIPVDSDNTAGHSSPTVGSDGTVYIGSSSDNKLYAVNDYAVPRNIKHNYVTSVNDGTGDKVGGETVVLDSAIDWLNGATTAGPWAVRLEVMRSLDPNADSNYEYTLHAWILQCEPDACANPSGTFYEDTRIQYSATPHLAQIIELTETEHLDFNTFIFGFTGATGPSQSQSAEITDFKLSFIRFNDPIAP